MKLENIKKILEYDKILIAGHQNPDSDSICSCISLGLALKKLGKQPDLYIKELSEVYNVLEGSDMFKRNVGKEYDLVIALDSGDVSRVEEIKDQFEKAKCTFNIDHHVSNTKYATYNYVEQVSSTGEMMYHVIKELGVDVDKDMARAIFVAVISDTGLYQYDNTSSNTYKMIANLMELEIESGELIRRFFFEKTVEESRLYGKALLNMEMMYDNKLAVSCLSLEEIKAMKIAPKNTSGIINQMAQIKDTVMTIFMYEPIPNNVKVSFRAREPYNVCELAQELGGGGHILAAGAMTKGTLKEMKQKVLSIVEKKVDFSK